MQCRCLWPEEVCLLYFWEKSDEKNPSLFALTSLQNKPDRSGQAERVSRPSAFLWMLGLHTKHKGKKTI